MDPKIDKINFYQAHLNRVSRSFAYGISILENPLREYVSLAYLLCRIIDTLEDSQWPNPKSQTQAFENLKQSLANPEVSFDISFLNSIKAKETELLLIQDSSILLLDYKNLPPLVQNHLKRLTLAMIDGMLLFPKGQLKLKSLQELNLYCFFVAGIVGECLTHLVDTLTKKHSDSQNLKDAYYFGLFLQKVNILKDQSEDEAEGRYFVSNRSEVFGTTLSHIKNVANYIQNIPVAQTPYKVFCMIAFLLGLKVLLRVDTETLKVESVPRAEAESLFMEIAVLADNNEAFNNTIEDFFKKIPAPFVQTYRNREDPLDLQPYLKILNQNNLPA